MEPEALHTLTFTTSERVLLAHALTIVAAMADTLGNDTKKLMGIWERVQPDPMEATS